MSFYEVFEINEGFSTTTDGGKLAMSTCSLIKGNFNCIVNTLIPADGKLIVNALKDHKLKPNDIHYVISTNGDPGNIGNNHLFLKSIHIVGHSISKGDIYYPNSFSNDNPYMIDEDNLQIIPTPGRTVVDITVLVKTGRNSTVAITGGLFEKVEDLQNKYIWLFLRPECPSLQRYNRTKIINKAIRIIPGHGGGFDVDRNLRSLLRAPKGNELLSLRQLYDLGLS
ncbi:metallo-beta-lactamase domain-containing protein 1 isoform X2 [Halyomorpha halys]|uniref:metallo-beta-lactamase domain-containing protein 1 isoform X2 n=1 Tax=Halyomorpha halys TaxID=286706 RepID=UPI0006D4CE12|nr:metallo-beta-lactamase domain-containing protein 1-like isoform X2 [Halyomorpha halys]